MGTETLGEFRLGERQMRRAVGAASSGNCDQLGFVHAAQ